MGQSVSDIFKSEVRTCVANLNEDAKMFVYIIKLKSGAYYIDAYKSITELRSAILNTTYQPQTFINIHQYFTYNGDIVDFYVDKYKKEADKSHQSSVEYWECDFCDKIFASIQEVPSHERFCKQRPKTCIVM